MQVIDPKQVMGSGHCVICERGIDKHTQVMTVDTLFDIELPGHYLDGRKYVCQGCVQDVVRTCGLMQATEVVALKEQLAQFKAGYTLLLENILGNINDIGNDLTNKPAVPDVSFANPESHMLQAEALDNEKPKRGRPAKEPF